MGTLGFMILYVFIVIMAVIVFGVGIVVGAYLIGCLHRDHSAERILKTHQKTVKQIDDVIDYYVGLQRYIAEHLSVKQK